MPQDRKKFLRQLGSGLLLAGLPAYTSARDKRITVIDDRDFDGNGAPDDEKYWKRLAKKYYSVSPDYINLENGYYGIQPKPVLEMFQKNIVKANFEAAKFARKDFPALSATIKKTL